MLALIGLPGAGKTTVGRRLANALNTSFVDLDRRIEEVVGCPIAQYFREMGEASFRAVEAQVLRETLAQGVGVLSTGGGSILREESRLLLRRHAQVVFLEAQPRELLERLRPDGRRPLFQGVDPEARLHELHAARDALYRATAHHIVSAGTGRAGSVVRRILAILDPATCRGTLHSR
ncbi:MAG: putative shikimate kinase [Pseudomonadota bacterium]|jgi:shikimate kinase